MMTTALPLSAGLITMSTLQFAESLRLLRKEVGWGPVDPERITVVQKVSVDQMCDLWRNVILGWDAGGFVGER